MNNEIYARLEKLMKSLGLSVKDGSFTKAEMQAYAAGIAIVHENMKKAMSNIFIDSADAEGTAMFLSMVSEKPAADAQMSKKLVINAVSDNPCIYSKTYFDSIVTADSKASYTVSGNIMDFNCNLADYRMQLEAYSKQISDINPCTVVINNNVGRSFDAWDSAALRWFELDRFEIPFITLDGIK